MSQVQDYFSEGEFEELLEQAERNIANDWEHEFVSSMCGKYEEYGKRMFLSDSQMEHLERIAGDS